MTDYTKDAHALPYPEGGNKVAVHSDIQALAVKTGIAISTEGARAIEAAVSYTDSKDASNRNAWAQADTTVLSSASKYADTKDAANRVAWAAADSGVLAEANEYTDVLDEYVHGYGFPVEGPDRLDFEEVTTDRANTIASGTKVDGTTYVAQFESGRTAVGAESLGGDSGQKYLSVSHDRGYWLTEPAATTAEGRTPEWVLRNHASRIGKALLGVACLGDSMTFGLGGGTTSFPRVLMQRTELPVWNYGVSGQSSTEVALRSGGLDVWLTLAGGQIPASGPVAVTDVIPSGKWHETSAWSYSGSIAGVPGVLTKSASGAWSFTRTESGVAVRVPGEVRWNTEHPLGPMVGRIIWVGRNYPVLETVLRDVRAMVADAKRFNAPYLVIPPFNNGSEPSGSAGYNNITAIGQALENEHGPNCYDLRGYVIRRGLADAGRTPTAADTTAISEDRIPPSLMSDNIHLNATGYTVVGNRLADVTTMKGWF